MTGWSSLQLGRSSIPLAVFKKLIQNRSTALFGFPLSLEVTSNQIRHFDFGRPIVNFAVLENDKVVLTLDANWRDPEKSAEQVNSSQEKMVRVVKLSAGEVSLISLLVHINH